MKLIYFHGFGSSAQSGTIRTLRTMLPDFEVIAPDIPVDPAGSDDKQVNGEHIFRQYYDNVIHFNGEHRMSDEVFATILIPLIRKITNC